MKISARVVGSVGWLLLAAAIGCGQSASEPSPGGPSAVEPPLPVVWGTELLVDENPDPKVVEVSLSAAELELELGGQRVKMAGYNGQIPGPMIRARKGDELIVHFANNLPEPTTIHWHGLRIPDAMDGSPRVMEPVQPGASFTYRFTVPEAGSFWYHPHVRAHEQVEAGLYAPLVVWDEHDPSYDHERYLLLDDVLLNQDGSRPEPLNNQQELMFGRYGNHRFSNGLLGTVLGEARQGQVERWRVVNTANARTMRLQIEGARVRVIGTDGGLLREPHELPETLLIAVGQRFDLEVSYDQAGPVRARTLFTEDSSWAEVLQIEVAANEHTPVPPPLHTPALPERSSIAEHTFEFDAVNGGEHGILWRINGRSHWEEPLLTLKQGDAVTLVLKNKIGPEHPFHLHGQFFRVLDDPSQPGLKDTVLVPGFSSVKIQAYLDNPGRWMAHCHILEHSELGMMADIVVEPRDGSAVREPIPGSHHH